MQKFIFALLMLAGCVMHPQSYIGAEYVGAKYINNPLGEERAPDTDPLIRFDGFDCVTFVETALAGGDVDKLNQIRYRNGDIDFINRNHFVESDWLTNNAYLVQNVSHKYGPVDVRVVEINRAKWMHMQHGIETDDAQQTISLEYIPYAQNMNIRVVRPHIVLFVVDDSGMRDTMGTDLGVVHMGFLLPNGVLRHASSDAGRVVDVDFAEYLAKRMQNKNNIGIALVEIK